MMSNVKRQRSGSKDWEWLLSSEGLGIDKLVMAFIPAEVVVPMTRSMLSIAGIAKQHLRKKYHKDSVEQVSTLL